MNTLQNMLSSVVLAAATLTGLGAQTTGVPGFNDLTVNALGSGTTSCSAPIVMAGGGLVNLSISTAPGVPAVYLFTPFCRCQPPFFPLPPSSSCPIPFTAGGGTTNQSIDLLLSPNCTLLNFVVPANAAGFANVSFTLPPGFVLGVQGASIHPCATGFPALFTQAQTIVT